MIRVDSKRRLEVVDGDLDLPLPPQGHAGVYMIICVFRIDLQGLVEMVHCLLEPPLFGQDTPQVVMSDGIPRLAPDALMRPWLQAFYYNGSQVLAEIEEAEARGTGWILWNAGGEYADSWLPPAPEQEDT